VRNRERKPDDQQRVEEAIDILIETTALNPQIEPTLWYSAVYTLIAKGMRDSGFSYEKYHQEMEAIAKHYKWVWDEE
jgi:hypothetical protein